MSLEDLKLLPAPPVIDQDGNPDEPPQDEQQDHAADPQLAAICAVGVKAIGAAICARANVDPLSDEEAGAIGSAAAKVMAQYDVASMSPRSAAWIGLGVAVVGVAIPRVMQIAETVDQPKPKTPSEPVPPQPDDIPDAAEASSDGSA